MLNVWILMAFFIGIICAVCVWAEPAEVTVTLEGKQSLRSLAKQHLGAPDDWKIILLYNGFDSYESLPPNASLVIPVRLYKQTMQKLRKARELSHQASMEGARVLARDLIEEAVRRQQEALEYKKRGQLQKAQASAQLAVQAGQGALDETQKKKMRTVSAILESMQGKVQSRKPDQAVWRAATLKQELVEKERIRTLSDSRARIAFIDESTLNLEANALAVIGMMRENRVRKSLKTDVTVLKGDVMLLMASLGQKNQFNLNAPGVETDIRSRKFRASRDADNITRISNYDGEIDIKAKGRKVVVKKNEGVKIKPGQQPGNPKKLLPSPQLTAPAAHQVLLKPSVDFVWKAVEDAQAYKLEISAKRNFDELIRAETVTSDHFQWQAPQRGVYYARMYTIDNEGLASPYSPVLSFSVNTDATPPYLAVHEPRENAVIVGDSVHVKGVAEKQAKVAINGRQVDLNADHAFDHPLQLVQGINTIVIEAVDPVGLKTVVKRHVTAHTEKQLLTLDVPSEWVVNQTAVTIKGRRRPGTEVTINGRPTALAEQFAHVVELDEGAHELTFKASAPPDQTQTQTIKIKVDLTPPRLTLAKPPRYYNQTRTVLAGSVSEKGSLTINAQEAALNEGQFKWDAPLEEGSNRFELIARDAAGNQTRKTVTILRDTRPPRITGQSLSKESTQGGESITLTVKAEDAGVGLARAGHFVLAVDARRFKGLLSWNAAQNHYIGTIFIPPEVKGDVRVYQIRIRDRLGNEFKTASGDG